MLAFLNYTFHQMCAITSARIPKLYIPCASCDNFIISIFMFQTVTFILICAIIWGAKMHDPHTDALGYSFTLSLSGACLLPLGAFLMFLASKRVTGQVHWPCLLRQFCLKFGGNEEPLTNVRRINVANIRFKFMFNWIMTKVEFL